VYCYAFLHVLKRDTCIKQEKTKKKYFLIFNFSFMHASSARVPARHAKIPWLEPCCDLPGGGGSDSNPCFLKFFKKILSGRFS
jgi:hypothetical protein